MTHERESRNDEQACAVPLEEQCAATLAHYEHLANVAHEWNNQVPQAIRAWYAAKANTLHSETPRLWAEIEKAKADAYEDAARRIEKLAEEYTHEHGSYDPSTNAWELHHRHGDRIEAWDDAVEAIRKRMAEKCHVTHALQTGGKDG